MMATNRYSVTYAFNGYLRGEYSGAVSLITETVEKMRREGIDIRFRGATQEINAAGQLIEVTARYKAPSEGVVGRLNCRACLPAAGPARRDDEAEPESMASSVAVQDRSRARE